MNAATGARVLSYGAGIVSAKSGADISIELSTAGSHFYGELTEAQARELRLFLTRFIRAAAKARTEP